MKEAINIAANAVVAKIFSKDKVVMDLVQDTLSYLVEGVEHMHAFQSGHWNGRSSFFTRNTGTFPAGFVHLVHHQLVSKGYEVRIVKKQAPAPLGPESPRVDEFSNKNPRYDFQMKALHQIEKHSRGIVQVATGGGKSKIAKLIMSRYRRMTLFITTRGVLMYQMKDQVEADCKFNVGIIGDGEFKPVKGINVGMVQTLVSQLEVPSLDAEVRALVKKKVGKDADVKLSRAELLPEAQVIFDRKTKVRARLIKLLELIEVVIGEEAHEAGGNSYYEILKYCKNAHIRVALTATPFMRSDAEDNMRLMAAFGPILIKVSEKLLIDRGILAKPYFGFHNPAPHPKLRRTSPWERAYKLGIVESPGRNADIVDFAAKAASYGLVGMVLVQRTAHGDILLKALRERGLRARFLRGENDQVERKRALKALGNEEIDTLIGTTILDVGVDVNAVGYVVLAGGYKAEVGLRQRIGRGSRGKRKGPNVTFIVDYTDEGNAHLRDHARTRRAIIEATPGFVEGILKPGEDFPWHLFDERKAA